MVRLMNRAEAACIFDKLFALADLKSLNLAGFETTPRNLGYAASNAAILADNVIPAAKDSLQFTGAKQIENVVNTGIMQLAEDGLSFQPTAPMRKRDFALALARALIGPDLDINHLEEALQRGLIPPALLVDDYLSLEEANRWVQELRGKLEIISIFVTSDLHGNWVPYTSSDGLFEIGSVARMQKIIQAARNELGADHVLFLDGGDSPYNTTLANMTSGDVSVAVLSAMSLDATVLGNHDFDMSFNNLLRLSRKASYPMLSANIRYKEEYIPVGQKDAHIAEFPPYIMLERGTKRLAILGLTDDRSAEDTLFSNTREICFADHFAVAHQLLQEIKIQEKPDFIIALSHLHSDNSPLMAQCTDIDLSIAGGNDIAGKPEIYPSGRYLINPGKHGEALSQINLVYYQGTLTSLLHNQLFLHEAYTKDPSLADLVQSYNIKVDKILDEPQGYLAETLPWSAQSVRTENSTLANLVSDALLDYFREDGAELCIFNGGGIRASLTAGPVSMRELTAALPFDNEIMLVELRGELLWRAVENGISTWPHNGGRFLQPAGFTYSFRAGAEPQLLSIKLTSGEELEMERKYKLVMNSFMAGGGNGYEMLNILNREQPLASEVKLLLLPQNIYIRDALCQYFQNYSSKTEPLQPDLSERRIYILQGDA